VTKICVLQHVEPETPGIIADALVERGVELVTVRTHRGERVPDRMDPFSGLLVMGGPMGVYEADRYPHLRDEIALIQRALADEKPVLGICLGSQLLAAAVGANVAPATKEIGWLEVTLAPGAHDDPLWRGTPAQFTAFHWHGDAFDLPRGAVALASSERTACQAFRHGAHAYGILFHMEVTEAIVQGMVHSFPKELAAAGVDGPAIVAEAGTRLAPMHRISQPVFDRWAARLVTQPA
jgi:GMP synthase (glutamine-hydrolysing)